MVSTKKKKQVKFNLGDVVQLNKFWDNRIGLVAADDKAWYVIKNRFSIAGCICEAKDVVKVIKRNAVPKRLLKYIN